MHVVVFLVGSDIILILKNSPALNAEYIIVLLTLIIPFHSSFGASILVDDQSTSVVFGQLAFNSQCFIVYENPSKSPGQWNNVGIMSSILNESGTIKLAADISIIS